MYGIMHKCPILIAEYSLVMGQFCHNFRKRTTSIQRENYQLVCYSQVPLYSVYNIVHVKIFPLCELELLK